MATSTDTMIFHALVDLLKTVPGLPPIAGHNLDFPAPGNSKPQKFVAIAFMPNRTRQITMTDDPQQKMGMLQATVMWPKGQGIDGPLDVAGAIIDTFKDRTLFASGIRITISSEPWAATPLQGEDMLNVPVTIPYIAFEPEA
jgi:hypothetical protein